MDREILEEKVYYYTNVIEDPKKLVEAIENDNKDPIVRHAGIMLMTSIGDLDAIDSLKMHANLSVRRAAVVALRRLESHRVVSFLADASPLVVLEAVRAIHDAPIVNITNGGSASIHDSAVVDVANR